MLYTHSTPSATTYHNQLIAIDHRNGRQHATGDSLRTSIIRIAAICSGNHPIC